MTSVSVLLFVTSKSTFINNEIMSPSMPNMTQIINSKSIAYFVISNMPRNGPIAVPNTKLKENKLMPSLFLLTGVTYAAIVPVAVVTTAVAIPFMRRTKIKKAKDPSIK